jgi:O-succinylbenzoic acid--CoA ligase
MKNETETYYLFGKELQKNSLTKFANRKTNNAITEDWEKQIFCFILEWFDENDFIIVKTSGSTGIPKEIKLQKTHMTESAKATLSFLNLQKGDKALLCLPATYIAGKMMIVRWLIGGLDLNYTKPTLNPKFNNNETFNLVALVPSMLNQLLKNKEKEIIESFENILLGGSSISKSDEDQLSKLKNKIWHTYGMTETITHIALRRINGENASAYFSVLKGVKLSISKDGTLVINYPKLSIINLVTNDLIELLSNGKFKILGRKDNVIISGGLKLFPEDIEKKIESIIENNFFILGIPDQQLGQKSVLFIEGKTQKTINQISETLKNILNPHELPREIKIVSKFEKTISGKIIRQIYL